MYIKELSIDQYGIFTLQKIENIPSGLTIVLGKNEAGKSTLLNYLRCMICGIPQKRNSAEYKRLPFISNGFSGRMLTSTLAGEMELRRKYHAGKKEYIDTLTSLDGKLLDSSLWLSILGVGIDLEIYRNIFGISLSELVELTKDDAKVKDILYGASLISGKSPSAILDEIESKSKKLYTIRGSKNSRINDALVERDKIETNRAEALQIMEEYEKLQLRLSDIQEELGIIEEEIQRRRKELHKIKEMEKGYELWKTIMTLPTIASEDNVTITPGMKDEFMTYDIRYTEIETEKEILHNKITQKEQEVADIHYLNELLQHDEEIQEITYQLTHYEHNLNTNTTLTTRITQIEQDIDKSLAELGGSYTRHDIDAISLHFTLENEIARIKHEVMSNENNVFHLKESIKEVEQSLYEIEQSVQITPEKERQYNEIPQLENTLKIIAEKNNILQQLRSTVQENKDKMYSIIESIPSQDWNEAKARESLAFSQHNLLNKCLEEYTTLCSEKIAIQEKQKESETYLRIKERELHTLRDSLLEYPTPYSSHDIKQLEQIESLLYLIQRLENKEVKITQVLRATLIGIVCFLLSSAASTLLPSLMFTVIGIIGGGVLSLLCAYGLYKLDKKIEYNSLLQQGTTDIPFSTLDELTTHIAQLQRKIGLANLSAEERLTHRERINLYIDMKKRELPLQKECEHERKQVYALTEEYKKYESMLYEKEKEWERLLLSNSLPLLPLTREAIEMFFRLRKQIEQAIEKEENLYYCIEEEENLLQQSIASLQDISITQYIEQEKPFYTQELMVEHCKKYLIDLQEEKNFYLQKMKEKEELTRQQARLYNEYNSLDTSASPEVWTKWLATTTLPSSLTPATIESFLQRIHILKDKMAEEQRLHEQYSHIQTNIEAFEQSVHKVLPLLPQKVLMDFHGLPLLHCVKKLLTLCAQEKKKEEEKKSKLSIIENESSRLHELQHKSNKTKEHLDTLLAQSNCTNKEEFLQQYARYEELKEKKKEKENYISSLLKIMYPQPLDEITLFFESRTELDIQDAVSNEENKLLELEQRRQSHAEEAGKIKEKLTQAEQGDVSQHTLAHAMNTAKIEKDLYEWYALKAMREIIIQAQKQCEEKYQPEVMRIASDIISTITCGAWNKILRSTENTIKIRNNDGIEKLPEELSRGTQEQMYLALRLAGACAHSMKTKEALPLLLDDITVNFDYERTRGVASALEYLTTGKYANIPQHQVFLFTCHESIVENILDVIPQTKVVHMEKGTIIS